MERKVEELLTNGRCIGGYLWPSVFRRTDLEDSLHLREFHPGMLTCEHLNNETPK